jgi:hypothetical protein
VITLISSATTIYLTRWLSKILKDQREVLTTTANLLASKNLETFQRLQWTTKETSRSEPVEEAPILDDEALAVSLAKRYEKMGLNPNMAYNQDDPDFMTEFGFNR